MDQETLKKVIEIIDDRVSAIEICFPKLKDLGKIILASAISTLLALKKEIENNKFNESKMDKETIEAEISELIKIGKACKVCHGLFFFDDFFDDGEVPGIPISCERCMEQQEEDMDQETLKAVIEIINKKINDLCKDYDDTEYGADTPSIMGGIDELRDLKKELEELLK